MARYDQPALRISGSEHVRRDWRAGVCQGVGGEVRGIEPLKTLKI